MLINYTPSTLEYADDTTTNVIIIVKLAYLKLGLNNIK